MPTIKMRDAKGAEAGSVDLDEATFGIEPNVPVMHQVVTAQLAAKRSGTQSTKTRAEVRGGGAKPWRQKGTGRARQGSIRSPQWRGGGVALGPKPRKYDQKTPKKMKKLALRSALSDRAADDKVVVLDDWGISEPSTKSAKALLSALELDGRVVLVVGSDQVDGPVWKSFRNLPEVHVLTTGELNPYDVLVSDWLVFTEDTLPGGGEAAGKPSNPKAAKAPAEAASATPANAEGEAEDSDEGADEASSSSEGAVK